MCTDKEMCPSARNHEFGRAGVHPTHGTTDPKAREDLPLEDQLRLMWPASCPPDAKAL